MTPKTAIAWRDKAQQLAEQATTEVDRNRALGNVERLQKIYQHMTGQPMPAPQH